MWPDLLPCLALTVALLAVAHLWLQRCVHRLGQALAVLIIVLEESELLDLDESTDDPTPATVRTLRCMPRNGVGHEHGEEGA